MPAKKGSAARDKHGNVVADRKPCLRVSLYLPSVGSAFGRGGGGDDDAGDDADPRGMSNVSASFAPQGQGDLRRVHSCHRNFAEVTLNPRFSSNGSNSGGTFELPLPCPRRVVQTALLASKSVSSSSSSSSSSSPFAPATGAAAHDAACKALLDYWAQGHVKIHVVDGDRFNEDIFLGEVSLLLSTFLVPTRRHSMTSIHAHANGGVDVAAVGDGATRAPLVVEGTYPMAKVRPGDRVSGTLSLRAALHLPDAAQVADLVGVGASPQPMCAVPASPGRGGGGGEDDDDDDGREAAIGDGSVARDRSLPLPAPALEAWEEEGDDDVDDDDDDDETDPLEPLELAPAGAESASRSRSVFDASTAHNGSSPSGDGAGGGVGEGEWDEEETDVLEVSFAPSSPKVTESPDRRRFRLRPAVSSFTQHGHHGQLSNAADVSIASVKSRVRVRPTTMAAKDEEACADGALPVAALDAPTTPKTAAKEALLPHPASPATPSLRVGGRSSVGSAATASPGWSPGDVSAGPTLRRSMIADVTRCLDSLSLAQENADDVLSRLQRRIEERQAKRRTSPAKGPDDGATPTTAAAADDTTTLTVDDEESSASLVNLTTMAPVFI
jgi:hypothetical protein